MERLSLVVVNSSLEVRETLAGLQAVSPTLLIRLHHLQLRARLVAKAL